RDPVPRTVLQSYEAAFQQELEALIERTRNPVLRQQFEQMRECPIIDSRGRCNGFANFILAGLIRSRIQDRYDLEAALGYVCERMLMDRSDSGNVRQSVFRGFQERAGPIHGNPLRSRFLKALSFAIRNIKAGRIPRLLRSGGGRPTPHRSPD